MKKYYSLSKNLKLIKKIIRETEGMDDETYKMLSKTLGYVWINHKQYKLQNKEDYDLGFYNLYNKQSNYFNKRGKNEN
tara:strand:- start:568 stop:801 length:234 start_codon:yes stop_codon:yes gene_type:complete